jgi:hypothetical protein
MKKLNASTNLLVYSVNFVSSVFLFQMMQTSHYLKKLVSIKKDMLDLHARSSKLKVCPDVGLPDVRTAKAVDFEEKLLVGNESLLPSLGTGIK